MQQLVYCPAMVTHAGGYRGSPLPPRLARQPSVPATDIIHCAHHVHGGVQPPLPARPVPGRSAQARQMAPSWVGDRFGGPGRGRGGVAILGGGGDRLSAGWRSVLGCGQALWSWDYFTIVA